MLKLLSKGLFSIWASLSDIECCSCFWNRQKWKRGQAPWLSFLAIIWSTLLIVRIGRGGGNDGDDDLYKFSSLSVTEALKTGEGCLVYRRSQEVSVGLKESPIGGLVIGGGNMVRRVWCWYLNILVGLVGGRSPIVKPMAEEPDHQRGSFSVCPNVLPCFLIIKYNSLTCYDWY